MKKKIFAFVITLCFMLVVPVSAFAEEYGTDYPSYAKYSGGAYIEVQSTLGRGTIIIQNSYKSGYIGFYGNSYSLCNISNSTITGRYIASNGTVYSCRFSSFTTPQYQTLPVVGTSTTWQDLNITKIYNTNVEFLDDTELHRNNKLDIFDSDVYKYCVVCSFFTIVILMIFNLIKKEH